MGSRLWAGKLWLAETRSETTDEKVLVEYLGFLQQRYSRMQKGNEVQKNL